MAFYLNKKKKKTRWDSGMWLNEIVNFMLCACWPQIQFLNAHSARPEYQLDSAVHASSGIAQTASNRKHIG